MRGDLPFIFKSDDQWCEPTKRVQRRLDPMRGCEIIYTASEHQCGLSGYSHAQNGVSDDSGKDLHYKSLSTQSSQVHNAQSG